MRDFCLRTIYTAQLKRAGGGHKITVKQPIDLIHDFIASIFNQSPDTSAVLSHFWPLMSLYGKNCPFLAKKYKDFNPTSSTFQRCSRIFPGLNSHRVIYLCLHKWPFLKENAKLKKKVPFVMILNDINLLCFNYKGIFSVLRDVKV